MRKGINLHVALPADSARDLAMGPAQPLADTLARLNPGLQLTVKHVAPPDGQGNVVVAVYITGEQEPAADFEALTEQALARTIADLTATRALAPAPPVAIEEVENENEDTGVLFAPAVRALGPLPTPTPAPTIESLPGLGEQGPPPPTTFLGCPAGGDGSDPDLNEHKNRTDNGQWTLVDFASVRDLPYPKHVGRRDRTNWTSEDHAAIAPYEGLAVQVEGWLKGAKPEGEEACNCHARDHVDFHLWLTETAEEDRDRALVCEVTPRVRALNPDLSSQNVAKAVRSGVRVRVSGWLLMDQEHPEQIGKTRATLWEIHPILTMEAQQGDAWVSLASLPPPPRGHGTRDLEGWPEDDADLAGWPQDGADSAGSSETF